MNYYLSPYVKIRGAFWPRGAEDLPAFGAIDFQATGLSLVGTDFTITDPQAVPLGANDLAVKSTARRMQLQSAFGVTLTADRLDAMVLELLVQHARVDGTRWRPLQPAKGRYEIFLGGVKIIDVPIIAGGVDATESFDTADSSTLGPDQSWTETSGAWSVASNTCQCDTANGNVTVRCNADPTSVDTYCFATIVQLPSDGSHRYGVCTRYSSLVETAYAHTWARGAARYELYKIIATNFTALAVGGTTAAVNDVVRGESSGSTQTTYRNAVSQVTVSDTAIDGVIIGGKRGGLYMNNANGVTVGRWDVFGVGDLGGAPAAVSVQAGNSVMYYARMRNA